jgi:hypothetical protein
MYQTYMESLNSNLFLLYQSEYEIFTLSIIESFYGKHTTEGAIFYLLVRSFCVFSLFSFIIFQGKYINGKYSIFIFLYVQNGGSR